MIRRLLLGLLLLSACVLADDRVFGPKNLFSLVPPAGYKPEKLEDGSLRLHAPGSDDNVGFEVTPLEKHLPINADTGPALVQVFNEQGAVKALGSTPMTVGGLPGVRVNYQGQKDLAGYEGFYIYVSDPSKSWMIHCITRTGHNEPQAACLASLQSLKFGP